VTLAPIRLAKAMLCQIASLASSDPSADIRMCITSIEKSQLIAMKSKGCSKSWTIRSPPAARATARSNAGPQTMPYDAIMGTRVPRV
jgi:hypothetical protein